MGENKKIDLSGDGGVLKEIIQEGTGTKTPPNGCKVSVHYTGRLTDGTVFDSSVERNEPFEFDLGKGRVIKGFEIGIPTMKLGEKCNFTFAPEYAYGSAGSQSIPPDSTLEFCVEMLGWKGEDISPNSDGGIERFVIEKSEKKRSPNEGALVKAHITGKVGQRVFDDREVQFDYGEGASQDVIEGVEIAIGKMSVGETCKVKIQPKYAFGAKGHDTYNIPPNTPVKYTIKLIDCEKGLEEWKLTDEERVAQAKIYKEKGTNYFKKENYSLAIKMYKKCANVLPQQTTDEECVSLKVAAYSNSALCHQKLNEQFEAKSACNEALSLDPNNIKALYRRGLSNIAINEFEAALHDFQKVLELEPTNKAALNQIEICKRKIKDTNKKEKDLYTNMFTKYMASNKEPVAQQEPDVLAKCGEWTEEDAKREADAAFERDNNIVMI